MHIPQTRCVGDPDRGEGGHVLDDVERDGDAGDVVSATGELYRALSYAQPEGIYSKY